MYICIFPDYILRWYMYFFYYNNVILINKFGNIHKNHRTNLTIFFQQYKIYTFQAFITYFNLCETILKVEFNFKQHCMLINIAL